MYNLPLSNFKNLIKRRTGLTFEGNRTATLVSGINKMMSARGLSSYLMYFNLLLREPQEFSALVNLLTINETYFFREPAHFNILSEKLLPELLSQKSPGTKLKILSAGCSTGEEPYSLIMVLIDKYGAGLKNLFSILGVDIDSEAIDRARAGIYGKQSFRSHDLSFRDKYFNQIDDYSYRLKDLVKDLVDFRYFNLLSETIPEFLRGMDVIFYRNVSIYFEAEVRKKIFTTLANLLNDQGYLILSSTETFGHDLKLLSLREIERTFLYQKSPETPSNSSCPLRRAPRRMIIPLYPPFSKGEAVVPPFGKGGLGGISQEIAHGNEAIHPESLFEEALSFAKNRKYAEALQTLTQVLELKPSFIRAYNLQASLLVNLKRLEEAQATCSTIIAMDPMDLEAQLLLGFIHKTKNEEKDSLKRFKEAVYLKPSCWLAHFYIAEISASFGDLENAGREFEIVIKLIEKEETRDPGLTFFPISFSGEQILHLCRHKVAKLKV